MWTIPILALTTQPTVARLRWLPALQLLRCVALRYGACGLPPRRWASWVLPRGDPAGRTPGSEAVSLESVLAALRERPADDDHLMAAAAAVFDALLAAPPAAQRHAA